ncbi:MAG: OmpA family protein [Nitrospira sp. CR1.3]|nr:OmpA family protein [Nitrospira sp. CR1.3]
MGEAMNSKMGKLSGVAALSAVLLVTQGCGMKWLQSDGEQGAGSQSSRAGGGAGSSGGGAGSEWNGQGVNPNFPGMAPDGSRGELSGFSQNPSEERLAHGGGIASKSYAGMNVMQHAELTREEKAAIEAGLQDVFFGYDQWTLSDGGMEALNHDAKWLKDHPGAVMKVEGHCDERGTTDYNVVLGDKRSKSARSYLIELGVNPRQIGIVSYGKERPFCMDHNEACYQQNRRGHVLLKVKK